MAEENPLISVIYQTEGIAKEKEEIARIKEEEARKASNISKEMNRAVEQIITNLLRNYEGSQEKLIQGYVSISPLIELANKIAKDDPVNAGKILNVASKYKNQIENDFGKAADTEYALTSWYLTRQLNELQRTRSGVTEVRTKFDEMYKEILKELEKKN